MLALHKTAGTWRRCLDAAIVLTAFARSLGVEDAIPAELLHVKPNFLLEDPGPNFGERSTAFTFVGRLVAEKGLLTLVDAWKGIPWPARLRLVGEGPLASQLATLSSNDGRIELVGRLSTQETLEQMRSARAVIVPSEWHEPFGRVVIEAFATGTPVIAARAGGITELVEDGRTGWLVAPGAPAELARAVSECWQDDTRHRWMQREARRAFETRYTADANYRMLMQVYRSAIVRSRRRIAA
jgi:glycosyltransferase involved in cell wall biosynthesis